MRCIKLTLDKAKVHQRAHTGGELILARREYLPDPCKQSLDLEYDLVTDFRFGRI